MKPEVKVILRSSCGRAPTISSIQLRYWRAIHSELMTYRVFSRNASSSRAIPVEKLALSSETMHMPEFRKNQAGMQPGDYLDSSDQQVAEHIWKETARTCLKAARELSEIGVHKQWANRMLEWFGFINVVVTSTDWDNFFSQRLELNSLGFPVAQDEFYYLAEEIQSALEAAPVQELKPGEWHLPYVTDEDKGVYDHVQLKNISVARCASVSYKTVDGNPMDADRALQLANKLIESEHLSPFEHQAMADWLIDGSWGHRALHGNFVGWAQNRHFVMEDVRRWGHQK